MRAADLVRAAPAQTADGRTARVFAAMSAGTLRPHTAAPSGEGVTEFASRRTLMDQSMVPTSLLEEVDQGSNTSDRVQTRSGSDDAEPLDERVRMMMSHWTSSWRMLYDGGKALLLVDEGERWTSFGDDDRAGPRGPTDPLWLLDALTGAHADPSEVGTEDVRGVTTSHYRVHLDLVVADGEVEAGVAVPDSGPVRWWRRMPAEVWLDMDGRVRRMAFPGRRSRSGPLWKITEIYEFGIPVPIPQPDPDAVVEPRAVRSWPGCQPDQAPKMGPSR